MAATGTGQTSVRGPQQAAVIGSGQKHSLPSLRRPVALCLATLRDNISSPLGRCLPKRKKVDGSAASGQASMGNYQTFANFLGKHADMNMFRRFGSLQAQNILFFQAELAYLEDELCVIRERRASGDPEKEHAKERHSKCFRDLQKDGESSEEFKKTMEIRAKLNEYSTYPRCLDMPYTAKVWGLTCPQTQRYCNITNYVTFNGRPIMISMHYGTGSIVQKAVTFWKTWRAMRGTKSRFLRLIW